MEYIFGVFGSLCLLLGFGDAVKAIVLGEKMAIPILLMVGGLGGLAVWLPVVAVGAGIMLVGVLLACVSRRGAHTVFWIGVAVVGFVIVLGAIDRSPSELHQQHTTKGATQRVASLFIDYTSLFVIQDDIS